MFPAEVVISSGELALLLRLAALRNRSNLDSGVRDAKWASYSGEELNQTGILAERAVATLLDVPMDLSLEPRSGGHDLDLPGVSVEVKATRHPRGRLMQPLAVDVEAEVIVFCTVPGPPYPPSGLLVTVHGWTRTMDLRVPERLATVESGKLPRGVTRANFLMRQDELETRPIPEGSQ